MDFYKLLHEDHLKAESLLQNLEDTTERDKYARENLIRELESELSVHSDAEEKFLYSRLQRIDATEDLAFEAVEQHKVIKTLLEELVDEPKGTAEWSAKLAVLKQNLEQHIQEEEGPLFSKAKKALSKEEAGLIGEAIATYKEQRAVSA